MIAPFPAANESLNDEQAENDMNAVMDVVRSIRNLRAELGVSPGKAVDVVSVVDEAIKPVLSDNIHSIKALARVSNFNMVSSIPVEDRSKYISSHLPGVDIYVEVAGLIDVEKELSRIDSELKAVEKELSRVNGKLSNEQFLTKAPAEIIEKERAIAAELAEKQNKLLERKRILAG